MGLDVPLEPVKGSQGTPGVPALREQGEILLLLLGWLYLVGAGSGSRPGDVCHSAIWCHCALLPQTRRRFLITR